ncbi:MAG: hypothetical protein K0A98_03055 [Trueperaceae bacterium]|nr:hypothetical protein [Trueperaceae bacterium]
MFGLDGMPVILTAATVAPSAIAPSASASFAGTIDETVVIDEADVPPALRNLFNVASVDEAIGLDVQLQATSTEPLPAAFVVSAASLTELQIRKGVQTVFSGDFSTVPNGSMTFTRQDPCLGDTCTYTASATAALVDVSVSGTTANRLAQAIIAGGEFKIYANFGVTVNPALPDDTSLTVVLVSLGAVLE